MASSFQGWGGSWAQTWERISDPNAMYGSASIGISATGTLTAGNATPEEAPKYYAVEKPQQSEGELLLAQAMDEDDAVIAMLQVMIMEM
jgi:hypothetical protein